MSRDRVQIVREKLDRCSVSDHYGLISPGLTCYLNSVLQVLFMTQHFREEIQRCVDDVSIALNGRRSSDAAAIDAHLDSLFTDLKKKQARTHSIIKELGITGFSVYEQRDAAEYFENILRLTSPEASKIFRGELIHKNKCLHCGQGNDSRSNFWILPLAVEDSHHQTYSVEQGFKNFFKGQKVSEDNVMFCNSCSEKRDAEIDCDITHAPEVLTLLLKRFSFSHRQRCYVKLHCKAAVPQTLHVKGCTYDLYALVHHYGDLTGGHYTAEIKSFETGEWYRFDDDVVQMVRQSADTHESSRSAYLLMYRKGRPHFEKPARANQEAGTELELEAGERERRERPPRHHYHQMNGGLLERSRDAVNQNHSSGELDKQKKQTLPWERPIKETLLPTDTEALRPRSAYSNTHTDERETHPKVNRFSPNPLERRYNAESHVRAVRSSAGGVSPPTKGAKDRGGAGGERNQEGWSEQRTDVKQLLDASVFSNGHSPRSPSLSRSRTNKSTAQRPVSAHNSTVEATKRERTADLMYNMRPELWK